MKRPLVPLALGAAALLLSCAAAESARYDQRLYALVRQGFGSETPGGEGGRIIMVTSLAPEGPGSLQEALDTPGPRTIRFTVAGTISLKRRTIVLGGRHVWQYKKAVDAGREPPASPYSYVTVDGASAPPPGVTVSGRIKITGATRHVILRHLRIRQNGYVPRGLADCISVLDGCGPILIDHCSLTWGRDETVNYWGASSDITLQWCILTGYGPHGFGFLNGSGADRLSVHHCLFAHNVWRNPRIGANPPQKGKLTLNPNPIVDFRSNLIYNWQGGGATHVIAGARVNLVGNLYEYGPTSGWWRGCVLLDKGARCHMEDNIARHRSKERPEEAVEPRGGGKRVTSAFDAPPVAVHPPDELRSLVLAQVGALPRDPIDAGIVRSVLRRSGSAGMKNTEPGDYSNARPQASIGSTGAGLSIGLEARVRDEDGRIAACAWDFGDGHMAVGRTARHEYAKPGTYVPTLFAMDDMGMTASASIELRIVPGGTVVGRPLPARPIPRHARPGSSRGRPPATVKVSLASGRITEGAYPGPEAWATAARLVPFVRQDNWETVPAETVDARLLHFGEALCLRVVSKDPFPDRIRPVESSVKDVPWSVEKGLFLGVWLSPNWGVPPWYHFVVNTDGKLYDALGMDRSWSPEPGWRARSSVQESVWTLEIVLPMGAFGCRPADRGARPGVKLCRYQNEDDIFIWPSLGPEGESAHSVTYSEDPATYARLVIE